MTWRAVIRRARAARQVPVAGWPAGLVLPPLAAPWWGWPGHEVRATPPDQHGRPG